VWRRRIAAPRAARGAGRGAGAGAPGASALSLVSAMASKGTAADQEQELKYVGYTSELQVS
jgi:hypothetical protein